MENLFLRVLTLSLTVSLVLLPLLALAPRLHHRYAGRTFYVLWLVLAVRLVLPLQPVLPEPAVTVELPPSQAVTVPAVVRPRAEAAVSDVPQSAGAAEPAPAAPEAGRTFSWTQLGTWLWLGGVAALLVYQGAGYALARRKLLRDAEPGSEEETALLAALAAGLENFQKTNTYTAGQFTDVPAGEWYDFYTGERFAGGQAVDVGCADTIPVFSLGGRWRANEV